MMTEFQPAITGIGGALGEERLDNQQLIDLTGIESTSDWIEGHTGILCRRFASPETGSVDLGTEAALEALKVAGLSAADIDGIFATTLTPDYQGSFTASQIHGRLGMRGDTFALYSVTACVGGVVGVQQAAEKAMLYPTQKFLTVGAEVMSRIVDYNDRKSVILFGDGAGAATVQSVKGAERPVFAQATCPDLEAIYTPAGGLAEPGNGPNDPRSKLQMDGKRVARHALNMMPDVALRVLDADDALGKNGVDWDRYALFVPHQANGKLIEKLWDGLSVPEEKRVLTVDKHGNTSSASVMLALRDAYEQGRLEEGGRILMTSVGAGMAAAAAAIDVRLGQDA